MRLPLVTTTDSRDGTADKDARLTNALVEGGKAVSRPAIRTLTSVTADTGKGLVAFGGKLISVSGQTCYAGGTELEKTTPARSTIIANYAESTLVYRANNFILSMGGIEPGVQSLASVYKSTNGTTWTLLNATPGFAADSYMRCTWNGNKFVHVTGEQTISYEVWNSTDGATWTKVISNYRTTLETGLLVDSLCSDTRTGKTYMVAFRNNVAYSLWATSDNGANWTKIKTDCGMWPGNLNTNYRSAQFYKGKIYVADFEESSGEFKQYVYELDPSTSGAGRRILTPAAYRDSRSQVAPQRPGLTVFDGDLYFHFTTLNEITDDFEYIVFYKFNGTGWTFAGQFYNGTEVYGFSNVVQCGSGLLQLPGEDALMNSKVCLMTLPTQSSVGTVSGDFFDFVESAT